MTRRGGGLTKDEQTAVQALSLALDLMSSSLPLDTDTVLSRHFGLVPGDARRRRSAAKAFERARAALEAGGLRLVGQARPDGGRGKAWSADPGCYMQEDGRLDRKEQMALRALLLPVLGDAGFPARTDLALALGVVAGDEAAVRALPTPPVAEPTARREAHVLDNVRRAMGAGTCLRTHYRKPGGEESDRELSPLALFGLRGHMYLEAARVRDGALADAGHVYRLDRMSATEPTRTPRMVPAGYVGSYPRLPFQLGSPLLPCTFAIPSGRRESLPALCGERGTFAEGPSGLLWVVQAADLDAAAAFGIAYGLVPLEPEGLVAAWRTRLEGASRAVTGSAGSGNPPGAHLDGGTTNHGQGRIARGQDAAMLLALAPRLRKTGDRLTTGYVRGLFGLPPATEGDKASVLLAMLAEAADGDGGACFNLTSDSSDAVELATPALHLARQLLPTEAELEALRGALDLVGAPRGTSYQDRLRRALDSDDGNRTYLRCALALGRGMSLTFDYRGEKNDAPRRRHVRPKGLCLRAGEWFLDALDDDREGNVRTFRVDSMRNVRPYDAKDVPVHAPGGPGELVTLHFADDSLLRLLDWAPNFDVAEAQRTLTARTPYSPDRSDWLVRRIAAGGGGVTTDDEGLGERVRAWAAGQLAEHVPDADSASSS